jgi:serine/threonine-protein kinase
MGDSLPLRLGRYELVEKLAVGGMAELFRARVRGEHGFEKALVIKRILPHLTEDPEFVEMFIDEAKITAQLTHPKIVQVHELQSSDEGMFIVMEYVDGLDLLTLIRQCKADEEAIPAEIAVHVVHEVLDALDYAHHLTSPVGEQLGIVHRDISPGNVLVARRGDVKLVDFGIARAAQRRYVTQTGTLKGKYGYMSPEQIVGKPLDGRSDLFSAAIVLAELLMLRRLFTAPNDLDVLMMVRDVRLDRLDTYGADIPPALREILETALQRDPKQRYETAGAFRDALGDWLFSAGRRVRSRDVAAFLRELGRSESEKMRARMVSEPAIEEELADLETISGPMTRVRRLEAERAANVGRQKFQSARLVAVSPDDNLDDDIPIVFEDTQTPASQRGPSVLPVPAEMPDSAGTFARASPIKVLHRLARYRLDGLLVVERGDTLKEAYFTDGDPQFIRSTDPSERLGEYLVASGVISQADLQRALRVLPHFGGRLGDTLVGLGLMRPLDAFRHLTQQVREKLIDVCRWTEGRYRWYADRDNPWPSLPLHLDTLEILGAGAMQLPLERMRTWANEHGQDRPARASHNPVRLDAFGLGGRTAYVYGLLDGHTTVHALARRCSAHDRLDLLRLLYLLVETDVVLLG